MPVFSLRICAEEEGDNLRTRAGIVRHELAAVALYDFLSKRPVHRGKRVARNGICVREAGHQLLQGDRLGRSVAEQKRDGLSTGAGLIGRERASRCTGGDALAERPADGLGVVAAFGDIAHVHSVVHHGRTCGTPQERNDLRTGAGLVGAEMLGVRARGDAFLRCPKHRIIEVIVRLDIHEVVKHRVVIHKGCFDLDLAGRHGEGVLDVILLGELNFLAILVQHGKCLKSIALVRRDSDGHGRAFLSILRTDGHGAVLRFAGCGHGIARRGGAAGRRTAAALCSHGHSADSRFLAVYRFRSDMRCSFRNCGHLAVFIDRGNCLVIARPCKTLVCSIRRVNGHYQRTGGTCGQAHGCLVQRYAKHWNRRCVALATAGAFLIISVVVFFPLVGVLVADDQLIVGFRCLIIFSFRSSNGDGRLTGFKYLDIAVGVNGCYLRIATLVADCTLSSKNLPRLQDIATVGSAVCGICADILRQALNRRILNGEGIGFSVCADSLTIFCCASNIAILSRIFKTCRFRDICPRVDL